MSIDKSDEGVDYLAVCGNADGEWAKEAPTAYQGIKGVIDGQNNLFTLEYHCHSPDKKRWFRMRLLLRGKDLMSQHIFSLLLKKGPKCNIFKMSSIIIFGYLDNLY